MTIRRWEAVGVLVALTLSFVVAIILVNRESKHRAAENRDLIVAIQAQRAEVTLTNCLDQNDRHDHTVMQLDDVLRKRKLAIRRQIKEATTEGERTALRAQIDALDDARASTISLIDALAPHQNCEQLVLDRFGYVPALPGKNPTP